MVATAPLAHLALVAAPLLAATLSSSAVIPQGQVVLGGHGDSQGAVAAPTREPDFVDQIVAEAAAAGRTDELMEKWGFRPEDIKVSMSAWRPVQKGKAKGQAAASSLAADLTDAAERAKLMAEAAAEDALVSIQPVADEASQAAKDAAHAMQPGSGWIWNVCGSRQEAVVLHTLDVQPDPPVAGKNLTVHGTGTVHNEISEGTYADVIVKLGFIRLLSRRFDVCELARENNAELQCPLPPGEYEMTHTVELPREIPPAKFNVHATGKTGKDQADLMCMDLAIDFSHR